MDIFSCLYLVHVQVFYVYYYIYIFLLFKNNIGTEIRRDKFFKTGYLWYKLPFNLRCAFLLELVSERS